MFTQCPTCKTVFRLHPDQINAAQGQVRCSRCDTVFNAVENLFQQADTRVSDNKRPESAVPNVGKSDVQEKPGQQPGVTAAKQFVANKAPAEEESLQALELDISKATDHRGSFVAHRQGKMVDAGTAPVTEEDKKPATFTEEALRIFSDEADESNRPSGAGRPHDATPATEKPPIAGAEKQAADNSTDEDEFGADLLSIFDQEIPESKLKTPPEYPIAKSPVEGGSTLIEQTTATSAAGTDKESDTPARRKGATRQKKPSQSKPRDLFSEENIEALISANKKSIQLSGGESSVKERGNDPLNNEAQANSPAEDGKTPPAVAEEALTHRQPPAQSEKVEQREEVISDSRETDAPPDIERDATEGMERPSYNLPLERSAARGSLFGPLLWGSGILLMLAVLALQYLYYHRLTLVVNPQLRPVLEQMCQFTGCQLPPRRDLTNIELGNHLVQNHPRYANSLLITATLINHADFTQPFPIVEVVMTDLDQKVIAQRRFKPEQYLAGENASRGFSPDTEVPLMLEVLDPGKNAVGFEFKFY